MNEFLIRSRGRVDVFHMCGILGIISKGADCSQLRIRDILKMRDTMTMRGPDGAGWMRHGQTTLAHRRLAIRDMEGGSQPFYSRNGRFVVVYNGEIYNDDEIKQDLENQGVRLKTRCDTEVLVEAWSIWGQACIDKLRGMFAFAVLDRTSGDVFLVRDRCGIKPLFYADIGNDFVFASSIAAIRKHPRFSSQPNFKTIRHYLQTLRITMGRETVFKGVYTVRPAELIHLGKGRRQHRTYWTLPAIANESTSFEEAVYDFEQSIRDSVKVRLKSDVPVGMMMSGGVDSNTLATFTRQQSHQTMIGVCGGGVDAGINDKGGDFEFAQQCANELGIEYSESRVSRQDYRETWESLISQYDTPVSTPTDAIIFHVAKQLRQSVGVAIGGEGADEVFCGYAVSHWSGNDFDRANTLAGCNSPAAQPIRESLVRQYGRYHFDSATEHFLTTHGLIPLESQKMLFNPSYWKEVSDPDDTENYYAQLIADHADMPMAQRYARVLFSVNLECLLGRLDSATMAASLEARVPYTDHLLVEKAFKLPLGYKIDVCPQETQPWRSSLELEQRGSLRSKRILRAVASRIMSRQLAVRPKMSFPTPLPTWLHKNWRDWVADRLNNSSFAQQVFQKKALQELSQLSAPMSIWNWPIVNTVLWGNHVFG